tara:strand:+ start:5374 stop:5868 length:495 start_codon:yes stop_codon:yes gene_type:complete
MKKIFLIFFLMFIGFSASSNQDIYFLDIDHLINNTKKGKLIISKLQKINEQNLIKLKKKEDELKLIESDILKKKNVISENEYQKNINDFKNKLILFEQERDEILNNFNSIKIKELDIYFNELTPLIEDFMEIKSIKMILDKKNIFIANEKYEITEQLIEYLNTN